MNPDVVVVGAGHNSLISAAYLSLAGLRVLVIEGQGQPGGNTMTEELTLPGFQHDSCSTAHTLIQSNPLLRGNELHLDALGLRYLRPDPVFTVPFRDGESITMHRDLERTVAEFARYSRRDAEAYRQLLADWEALRPLQAAERNAPPRPPEEADRLWRTGPSASSCAKLGDEGLRIRLASGLQIIQERFESPHVQTFMAWIASMTLDAIDHPATGILPFSLTAGRQEQSWAIPVGGSRSLPDALVTIIRRCGGDVICGSWVREILIEGNRAVGVVTDGGSRYRADSVLSSAHIAQLPDLIGQSLDQETAGYIDRWQTGLTMFVTHWALDEMPYYRTRQGPLPAVAMGTLESIDNLHRVLSDFRRGRLHLDEPLLLCLSPTIVDPSRAPAGRHTLKVISFLPYSLAEGPDSLTEDSPTEDSLTEGPEHWDAIKDWVAESILETYLSYTTNLTERNILGRHVESPLDLERRNPNNYRGSCHAGAQLPSQSGWYRPAPAWNGYRTPIAGLYLTGASTHPGGSVSGFPGRNAARVMLEDLGRPWDEVLRRAEQVAAGSAGAPAE